VLVPGHGDLLGIGVEAGLLDEVLPVVGAQRLRIDGDGVVAPLVLGLVEQPGSLEVGLEVPRLQFVDDVRDDWYSGYAVDSRDPRL